MDRVRTVEKERVRRFVDAYHDFLHQPTATDVDGGYAGVVWEAEIGVSGEPVAVVGTVPTEGGRYVHLLMHDGTRAGLRGMSRLITYALGEYEHLMWYARDDNPRMRVHYDRIGAISIAHVAGLSAMIHEGNPPHGIH